MINQKRYIRSILLIISFVLSINFVFCGNNGKDMAVSEKTSPGNSGTADQKTHKLEKNSTTDSQAVTPSDWQVIPYEQVKVTLPKDWKGDEDTNIWCPSTERLDMGRPKVSMFMGDLPIMPGTTLESQIKTRFGGEPQNKKTIEKCGLKGFTCEWINGNYRHMGIFLVDGAGAGIGIATFIELEARSAEFEKYRELYTKILSTVECNN